jgi:hypothetical protein
MVLLLQTTTFENAGPDLPPPLKLDLNYFMKLCHIRERSMILTEETCNGALIDSGSVATKPVLVNRIYASNSAKILRML